jgi:hypothetical protein
MKMPPARQGITKETDAYIVELREYDVLRKINKRLYAPDPLTGDERRDLANLMAYMIDNFVSLTAEDLEKI